MSQRPGGERKARRSTPGRPRKAEADQGRSPIVRSERSRAYVKRDDRARTPPAAALQRPHSVEMFGSAWTLSGTIIRKWSRGGLPRGRASAPLRCPARSPAAPRRSARADRRRRACPRRRALRVCTLAAFAEAGRSIASRSRFHSFVDHARRPGRRSSRRMPRGRCRRGRSARPEVMYSNAKPLALARSAMQPRESSSGTAVSHRGRRRRRRGGCRSASRLSPARTDGRAGRGGGTTSPD